MFSMSFFFPGGSPLVGQKVINTQNTRELYKQLKKSFEKQKELENHLKTWRTLKNKKKLEKTKKKQKTSRKQKKKQLSGGLGEAPQLPEESRIYVFFCFIVFFWFSRGFFSFLKFLEFFCFVAVSGFSPLPPSFFK